MTRQTTEKFSINHFRLVQICYVKVIDARGLHVGGRLAWASFISIMYSSVRLWSHDAICLNGLLLENIIVLLPCIFVIAAKVTSEFLPTGWARSTGSAWAWWISRSAGKMVCVLFKLQVEAKGRFWRRWRDPSTLRNGFHPLVSSLKAAFFFLLRRCRCWLGIYHTGWEQCKILHVCKSWWSVIWVHFKVVNSNRTFWPLLF